MCLKVYNQSDYVIFNNQEVNKIKEMSLKGFVCQTTFFLGFKTQTQYQANSEFNKNPSFLNAVCGNIINKI